MVAFAGGLIGLGGYHIIWLKGSSDRLNPMWLPILGTKLLRFYGIKYHHLHRFWSGCKYEYAVMLFAWHLAVSMPPSCWPSGLLYRSWPRRGEVMHRGAGHALPRFPLYISMLELERIRENGSRSTPGAQCKTLVFQRDVKHCPWFTIASHCWFLISTILYPDHDYLVRIWDVTFVAAFRHRWILSSGDFAQILVPAWFLFLIPPCFEAKINLC